MKIKLATVKCIMCKEESEQQILYSNSIFGKPDLDMRPSGSKASPAAGIQECPHCHYCNYDLTQYLEETYKTAKAPLTLWVSDENIRNIIENEPDDDARKCMIMAQQSMNNEDFDATRNMLIRAYWCTSFEDQKIQYRNDFIEVFEYYSIENEIKKYIQLSDVLRQAGEFEKAQNYLNTAKSIFKNLPIENSVESTTFFEECFDFEEELINDKDVKSHNLSEY